MENFDRAGRLRLIGDLERQLELSLGMLVILLRHCTNQRDFHS
jgi:hypothetical protein